MTEIEETFEIICPYCDCEQSTPEDLIEYETVECEGCGREFELETVEYEDVYKFKTYKIDD
jgi:hypothetical protein